MRFFPKFLILLMPLLTTACVSVSTEQLVLNSTTSNEISGAQGVCDARNVAQDSHDTVLSDSDKLDPQNISILNWNIYKGQRDNWPEEFRKYSSKHDIIIIQEAHLGSELQSILARNDYHWTLNTAFYYHDKATGVMTASSVKPVYSCGQRITEPLIRTPKTALINYFPIAGQQEYLLVANIHSVNFTFGVDVYKQQIKQLYEVIRQHEGPVVLAGDFNTWSDARMRIMNDMAEQLSLSSLDYSGHNRTIVLGNVIDHMFYRGLIPIEYKVWPVTSSNHNPIHASFRVNSDFIVSKLP